MLNYAPGLTRIRFLHFVTVTFCYVFPSFRPFGLKYPKVRLGRYRTFPK